jgi:hypothetical protein
VIKKIWNRLKGIHTSLHLEINLATAACWTGTQVACNNQAVETARTASGNVTAPHFLYGETA